MNTLESVNSTVSALPRFTFFRELFVSVGNLYCRTFHGSISRPVAGKYHCWKCLRNFDLEW